MKYIFILLVFFSQAIHAQSCDQFPADCPETGNIEAAQDSDACIKNMMVAQEITMQNQLRKKITDLMQMVADKNKWDIYEFAEEAASGSFRHKPNGDVELISYSLRPPHEYSISFIFILNKDSLEVWKNWLNNELIQKSNDLVESYKQNSTEHSPSDYSDSALYYGNLKTKYITDHTTDYQKALVANDQKGIKKYEDEMKKLDDKIDYFTNKANSKTNDNFSTANENYKDLQYYKHQTTLRFRNATMIRIKFDFNANNAAPSSSETMHPSEKANCPEASLAAFYQNTSPDENEIFDLNQFTRCTDFAWLLFGKWNLKEDQYHSYHSLFSLDKKNTDMVTLKKILCDQVQTMVIHLEGSKNYINRFLQSFDIQKLSNLVTAQ